MSGQATIVLPTVGVMSGLSEAQKINAAIAALVGKNGGAAAPANAGAAGNTTEAMMDWWDTVNALLKMRGSDDLGWAVLGAMGAGAAPLWTPYAQGLPLTPYASGFRNRVINGEFQIDQANAGAAVSVNAANIFYGPDMWNGFGTAGAGVFTLQQGGAGTALGGAAPNGYRNYLQLKTTTADAAPAAASLYIAQHRIEGLNVVDFQLGAAGAITFATSLQMRSSLTGTFSGSFHNGAADRSYPWTCAIGAANVWTPVKVTVPGDQAGAWVTDINIGLILNIDLGCGANGRGPAGAWAAAAYRGVTGAVRLISTLNATLDIAAVQVEPGGIATPFEKRAYPTELSFAQRYLPALISEAISGVDPFGMGWVVNVSSVYFFVPFRVRPRVRPSGYVLSAAGDVAISDLSGNRASNANALAGISFEGANIRFDAAGAPFTAGQAAMCYWNSANARLIFTGARL